MGEKLDPYGPRRPNESRSAYMRRIFDRKPRPRTQTVDHSNNFWMSILLDYIRNNPGCNQSEAARSVEPYRSAAFGRQLVRVALAEGHIHIVKKSATQGHQCYIKEAQ